MNTTKNILLSLLTVYTVAIPSYLNAACAAPDPKKTALMRKITYCNGTHAYVYDPQAQAGDPGVYPVDPDRIWVANSAIRRNQERYNASIMTLRNYIQVLEKYAALQAANPDKEILQDPITGEPEVVEYKLDRRSATWYEAYKKGEAFLLREDKGTPPERWEYKNHRYLPKK